MPVAEVNPIKDALEAVRIIVSDDLQLSVEWALAHAEDGNPFKLPEWEQKLLAEKFVLLYTIAHGELSDCGTHEDWKLEKYKVIEGYHNLTNSAEDSTRAKQK